MMEPTLIPAMAYTAEGHLVQTSFDPVASEFFMEVKALRWATRGKTIHDCLTALAAKLGRSDARVPA